MTYRESLEVLDAVIEKAATEVGAGTWVTVGGRHMLIPTDQYHPTHGWVKVNGASIPESTMGRQSAGTYHATKPDGTKVDFKEGESTHHAISQGGKVAVYNTEQGKKVGEYPAGQPLPAPTGGAGETRHTVPAGARERAPVSPTGIIETPRGTGEGANEPRVAPAPSGPERYSTKPVSDEIMDSKGKRGFLTDKPDYRGSSSGFKEKEPAQPSPGTHEHYAGEYPGKGKRGNMADLHEHLRQNGFGFDHAEGEKNQYGSPTDKMGNALVYKHPDGREARMVNVQPADQTWETSAPSYNPETRMTSTSSRMRRPATEYELQ